MYVGLPNANILMPLEKMRIINEDPKPLHPSSIEVLYNPQSYDLSRSVSYAQIPLQGSDAPVVQFQYGSGQVLRFDLFFDSLSAGSEVGGTKLDKLKFAGNSLLPSTANAIDVRTYTNAIFKLMETVDNVHRPPRLTIEWSSLQFKGYLASCEQDFLKFDESGAPVRAILHCTFIEDVDLEKLHGSNPLGSPDATKFRTVREGDSLWAMSVKEYGEAGSWREIARANGIVDPRRLRPGDVLVIPALKG